MHIYTNEQYTLQKHLETKGWYLASHRSGRRFHLSPRFEGRPKSSAWHPIQGSFLNHQQQAVSTAESVVLLGHHLFWEEDSGMLYLCSMFGDRKICLNVPAGQWKVREPATIQ